MPNGHSIRPKTTVVLGPLPTVQINEGCSREDKKRPEVAKGKRRYATIAWLHFVIYTYCTPESRSCSQSSETEKGANQRCILKKNYYPPYLLYV